MLRKSFTCNSRVGLLFQLCPVVSRDKFQGGVEGLFALSQSRRNVMNEFVESARRETGDSNMVSFLTAALIAGAAVLLIATSFAVI